MNKKNTATKQTTVNQVVHTANKTIKIGQEKFNDVVGVVSTFTEKRLPKAHGYAKKNKKKLLWLIPVLLIGGFLLFKNKGIDPKLITITPVETKDLISTVKASGKVTSVTDLELSFKASDIVSTVNVSVGDKVKKGQILAMLKNQNELGIVNQARGVLQGAQAGLERTLEGATSEEVRIAQVLLDNAKKDKETITNQQNTLVENARRALFSTTLEAKSTILGLSSVSQNPIITGTYSGSIEGEYIIDVYSTGGGYYFNAHGLSSGTGIASTSATSIGNGLYVQFPPGFQLSTTNSWKVKVPNTENAMYTTNLNVYQSALSNQVAALSSIDSTIAQREAELALKKAEARPADVSAKKAEVLRAQGGLQSALGAYENTVIRAPANGTVTKADIKVGELAKSLDPVIVIQDVGTLYVEANINESNITMVKMDQPVEFTIDAFGSSRIFKGSVTQVDPSATVKDGIVNYKVKASLLEKDVNVRPGMNANLVITTGIKEKALAIPGAAITKTDGKSFARVITDEKKKAFKEVEVLVGITGDGNMVEIIDGLILGQKVALIEKTK